MSLGNKIEDWLDQTIGRSGRKALEQVAHFLLIGFPWGCVPAGTLYGIEALAIEHRGIEGFPFWGFLLTGLFGSLFRATWREYKQNVGDPSDETTLIRVGNLPINRDLILDWSVTSSGGIGSAILFWLL